MKLPIPPRRSSSRPVAWSTGFATRAALVCLFFTGLTVACLLDLVLHVDHAFVEGRFLGNPRDSLIHMAILEHVAHSLFTNPSQLSQPPILHPHRDVLAYTDPQLTQAVVSLPLWLFTDNVALIHNLLLLASFVACGGATWLLVRHLTGSDAAGIVAGIVFAFAPDRFYSLSQIQILWAFWMPLALLALHRWSETGRTRYAAGFALLAAAQALSSLYLGLFFLTLALPFGVILLARAGRLRRGRPGSACS